MRLSRCCTLLSRSTGLSQALSLFFLSSGWRLRVAIKTIFENKPKGKELNKSPDEYRAQLSEIIVVNNSHVPIRNKRTDWEQMENVTE